MIPGAQANAPFMNDRPSKLTFTPGDEARTIEILSQSVGETLGIGALLARWLRAGDVLLLHGDLGAGKTVLAKGIASGLKITAPVASPSFALVNEYAVPSSPSRLILYHLDLYRLDSLDELETIGFTDIVHDPAAITLVEWPERALGALPERYLVIEIAIRDEGTRGVVISGYPADGAWQLRLNDLDRRVHELGSAGVAK